MPSSTRSIAVPLPGDERPVDRRNLLLCAVVPLAALAVAWPVAEVGIHDDAAFIHVAKTLAATGRLAYNGWEAMPLGFQAWWAAVWLRLLGFSFTVTRLSLLPLALAVPPLVYLLARRARLSATDSLFAAALMAAHEEFLDLAPTFMSDISSLCLLLASLLAFTRAVESADGGHLGRVLGWLFLGMLCGVVGGTIRQNVWFVLIAGPAVLGLRPHSSAAARLAGSVCLGVGVACIVLGIRWFNAQPYAMPTGASALDVAGLRRTIGGLPKLGMTAVVGCVLPAMTAVAFCLPAMNLRMRPRWLSVASLLLSTATCLWMQRRSFRSLAAAIVTGRTAGGAAAACTVTIGILGFLRWLALFLVVTMAAWDALRTRSRVSDVMRRLPPALVVLLAYSAIYIAALTQYSKTTDGGMYPRYFLVVLPALTCCLLYWVTHRDGGHERPHTRRSMAGWLILAAMAAHGIVRVHDHFANARAREAAIGHLLMRGVPRTRICGGYLIDHWEQLERAGHLNNYLVRNPPGSYRPVAPDGYPSAPGPRERDLVDVMTPEYVIDYDPPRFPGDGTVFPTFPYAAWWPATRGVITIQHQTPAPPATKTSRGTGADAP